MDLGGGRKGKAALPWAGRQATLGEQRAAVLRGVIQKKT